MLFLSPEQYRARFGVEPDLSDLPEPPPPRLPSVVLLLPDHGPFLWDRSPDGRAGQLDPADLGLSARLTERLEAWAERQTLSGSRDWAREGEVLARELRREFDRRGLDVAVHLWSVPADDDA
ncbi:hypothetical protein DQ237_04510 [Blastococcus sp. TF02-8]|nr:hypothetical protein DQ237_04510 [Blastococcus sp. TF02-8]